MKLRTLFIVLCVPSLLIHQSSAQSCGWRRTSRIVNGVDTLINEFPAMAGIVQNGILFCGGTILAEFYVLSSAHCLAGRSASTMQVLVGDWDYSTGSDTNNAAVYLVQGYVNHPSFNSATSVNDISIIRTTKSIIYNIGVGPACLPPTNLLYTNSNVEAVGWGTLSYGGPRSSILKKVTLGVVSNQQCSTYNSYIVDSKLCTYAANRDACQYDSGGPLFFMLNGRVTIVGIIVAGSGCATSIPAINTRVSSYVTWIKQNTPGATYY